MSEDENEFKCCFSSFYTKNFCVQTKITNFAFQNALLTRHAMERLLEERVPEMYYNIN